MYVARKAHSVQFVVLSERRCNGTGSLVVHLIIIVVAPQSCVLCVRCCLRDGHCTPDGTTTNIIIIIAITTTTITQGTKFFMAVVARAVLWAMPAMALFLAFLLSWAVAAYTFFGTSVYSFSTLAQVGRQGAWLAGWLVGAVCWLGGVCSAFIDTTPGNYYYTCVGAWFLFTPVSYTHLMLPTIYSV